MDWVSHTVSFTAFGIKYLTWFVDELGYVLMCVFLWKDKGFSTDDKQQEKQQKKFNHFYNQCSLLFVTKGKYGHKGMENGPGHSKLSLSLIHSLILPSFLSLFDIVTFRHNLHSRFLPLDAIISKQLLEEFADSLCKVNVLQGTRFYPILPLTGWGQRNVDHACVSVSPWIFLLHSSVSFLLFLSHLLTYHLGFVSRQSLQC